MPRIALVTGPDPGHALVTLGLARALRAAGHTTLVATGRQHVGLVLEEGHRFTELPLLAPTPDDGDFGHRLWRRAGQMAPPLRSRLAPWRPDAVVADVLTTVGAMVADLLAVPWIEVSPHHCTDPDPLVAPIGLGLGPARTPRRRRDDAAIRAAQRRDLAAGHALRDEVRGGLGLGPATSPLLRLLQTLPGLEPRRVAWPARTHVVGQLAIDPPLPPLPLPPGDRPLVVVTDSTARDLPTPLGAAAVSGLAGADVRLVVTGAVPGPVPPGVVVGRGPHEPLLEAAAVAVGPGGGGFTAKALTRGVPMVVVPLAGDQRETAGRVARQGAGVWVRPAAATPTVLRRAVARVLADGTHAAAARRLARGAAGLGADHAAGLVTTALAGGRLPTAAP